MTAQVCITPTTPDPYRATATSPSDPGNPQSWNRYAYVGGDPINVTDPHGLLWCVDCPNAGEDSGDPDLPCFVFDFEGNIACDNPGDLFVPPPRRKLKPKPILLSTFLLVTGDCYYTSPFPKNEIRRRTYEVLDQNYQPMGNGIAVEENISNVTPSGNSITGGGPPWITGTNGEPASSFQDFYSNGNNTSPTNALQNFFAVINSADLSLTVLEPNNQTGNPATYPSYGTQGVFYSHAGVRIDGYFYNPIIGSGTNDKPCDPPTPALP